VHSCGDVLGENDFDRSVRIGMAWQDDSHGWLYVFVGNQQAEATCAADRGLRLPEGGTA
jgi:hypothetical protein